MSILIFLIIYGLLSIIHIFIQIVRSELYYRENKIESVFPIKEKVTVILPVYNEKPEIVNKSIHSIINQTEVLIELIVIDDFSTNRVELMEKVYSFYQKNSKVQILLPDKNNGKRKCQKMGFDRATGAYIVTVDSDTILNDKQAVLKIVQPLIVDKKIGAVTGNVSVENKNVNLLTTLINFRYWLAFNQERAAQSLSGVVMCCSGPFSVYRKEIIDEIKEKYVRQKFLGIECTYGDDRHLTNLILSKGYKAVYHNQACASTYVPETVRGYIKQQIRWNKSFYREILWTFKFMFSKPFYLIYDLFMQLILPFMLIIAILLMIYQSIIYSNLYLLFSYISMIIVMSLIRVVYGIYRTRNIKFFVFVLYGFIHVLLLIPIRMYALFHLKDNNWGTR